MQFHGGSITFAAMPILMCLLCERMTMATRVQVMCKQCKGKDFLWYGNQLRIFSNEDVPIMVCRRCRLATGYRNVFVNCCYCEGNDFYYFTADRSLWVEEQAGPVERNLPTPPPVFGANGLESPYDWKCPYDSQEDWRYGIQPLPPPLLRLLPPACPLAAPVLLADSDVPSASLSCSFVRK